MMVCYLIHPFINMRDWHVINMILDVGVKLDSGAIHVYMLTCLIQDESVLKRRSTVFFLVTNPGFKDLNKFEM